VKSSNPVWSFRFVEEKERLKKQRHKEEEEISEKKSPWRRRFFADIQTVRQLLGRMIRKTVARESKWLLKEEREREKRG